jgi:hypothetical protein
MRRWLLALLVASVALNAALGIAALVVSGFGALERRVLLTSLAVSAAGVLGLACTPALERGRLRPLPRLGLAATVGSFALFVALIWLGDPPEALGKAAGTLLIGAVAAAHGSLVGLARLARRYRLVAPAAAGLALLLAAVAAAGIWSEPPGGWYPRLVGVLAVLLAAFTLLVPILHRASRTELSTAGAAAGLRFCPYCGAELAAPEGVEASCGACGARFTVMPHVAGQPRVRPTYPLVRD